MLCDLPLRLFSRSNDICVLLLQLVDTCGVCFPWIERSDILELVSPVLAPPPLAPAGGGGPGLVSPDTTLPSICGALATLLSRCFTLFTCLSTVLACVIPLAGVSLAQTS
jgi:hypothetical protein